MSDLLGAELDDALLELAASARGAPFWLTELFLGLREEHLVGAENGRAVLRAVRLPARLRDTMRDRLGRMSPAARNAASVASVLGRRFTFDVVARVLDVSPSDLLEPVRELLEAGILVEEEDRLAFRHDILREGVLDSLPGSARGALERQAARVLLQSGALPVEVAAQLAASARPGDSEAIDVLMTAAKTVGASDPGEAAALSRRALELTLHDDPRRGPLVAQTAILLHASGRLEEATVFADHALTDLLTPDQESEVRFAIAGMFSLSSDVRADASRRALALAVLSSGDRARHLARLAYNVLAAGRRTEVQQLLPEVRRVATLVGDSSVLFSLQLTAAGLRYQEGDFQESLDQVEAIVSGGAPEAETARLRIAQEWRSVMLATLDRFDESVHVSALGLESAQRDSQAWAVRLWEQWRGRQRYQLGEFSDAIATLEGMYRPEARPPSLGINDASALSALAGSALHAGDRQLMQRCAELAAVTLRDGTPELRRHDAWILAQQAMADGDAARGRTLMTSLDVPEDEPILPFWPVDVVDDPQLVRLGLAAGDHHLAERACAIVAERAERNPHVHTIRGAAAHALGLLNRDPEALTEAIRHYQQSPRRPALASALEDAGATAAGDGRTGEAIELLGRALELAAEMGARWDATRIRKRLRDLGVRRRLITPERPASGWEALTSSELAVVWAITGGMTNGQAGEHLFVSPHTINSHLRHIFAKLGINSRVELARMAGQHDRSR